MTLRGPFGGLFSRFYEAKAFGRGIISPICWHYTPEGTILTKGFQCNKIRAGIRKLEGQRLEALPATFRGGYDMLLRCEIKKEGDLFVGICLENSVSAFADDCEVAKRKLEKALRSYYNEINSDTKAHPDREYQQMRVSWYWARRLRFELVRMVRFALRARPRGRKLLQPQVIINKKDRQVSAIWDATAVNV